MAVFIGFFGAILGALLGAIATYLTTRSNMRLILEHSYDQTLQGKRLDRYQTLFHVSKCLPRYRTPIDQEPTRQDLRQYIQGFHDWYFGEDAEGMFLTPAAKDAYIRLLNLLAEAAFANGGGSDNTTDLPLSATESQALRESASELRHNPHHRAPVTEPARQSPRPSPQTRPRRIRGSPPTRPTDGREGPM